MSLSTMDLWILIKSFFEARGLVRQHLDSYNEFVEKGLQDIINQVSEIHIDAPDFPYKVKFGRIEIGRPRIVEVDGSDHPIYPTEARLRNLTYKSPMYLEMSYVRNGREGPIEFIHIGDIPVMLKSKLCPLYKYTRDELISIGEDPYDPGGYFIVNGSERVIVALEDLAPNRILVDLDKHSSKPVYTSKVFSTTIGFRARITCRLKSKDGTISVSIPGVSTEIPFVVLMRALGIKSDKEIADSVSPDKSIQDNLEPSFEAAIGINTIDDALDYLGNIVAHGQVEDYRLRRAESVLDRNFLPHIGNDTDNRIDKTYFLSEMARRIIELKSGMREPDDKDHYANKRLKLAGSLIEDLFRTAFRNLCRDIKYLLERMSLKRKRFAISAAVRHGIITERLKNALATGNWGHGKVGITQLLDRTNYTSTLSHLRRLQSPLSRSQPNFEARDLHSTHWGRLCPNETPEGSNCGLVKNLSFMASISIGVNPEETSRISYWLGTIPNGEADEDLKLNGSKVFVDGNCIGYSNNPESLLTSFKRMRRNGEISSELNIVFYPSENPGMPGEVYINCGIGRVRRPLIVVEEGKPLLTKEHIIKVETNELGWTDLIKDGIIENLDADEEENSYIALQLKDLTPEHSHLEIATYTILGICASIIPFAEHNQSPRNSYEAAMAKQALGIPCINLYNRADTQTHILHYPQTPLVITKPMETIGYNKRPSGQNFVVAILSFEGYNMEDALVFNKSAIDRGLARSTFYRVYKAEGRQYLGGLQDKFEIPESGVRGFRGEESYRLIEPDGVISVESYIEGNDVLIGRTSPPRFLEEYKDFDLKGPSRRDTSVTVRPAELGTVDDVFMTGTTHGSKMVKVRVRDQRTPELGDKFASRHGQKGVIGMVISQEDMPFTEKGIVPDVIINPHAMPSRMTIGQLVESITGKLGAVQGSFMDGTPFENVGQDTIRKALQKLGFQYSGKEVMYNGVTGEKFETDIFIGIVYYQKLHHMVADKMHARARGQVQMLTRQPTEGRARGGGLRFGEMERDCLVGHGTSSLLKDRLLEESDKSVVYVCENCGYLAYYDFRQRKYTCKICGDEAVISPTAVSYAFKLLLQELMSLCISPRLNLMETA
jgi:DNA-directed RNA polymerase subunit B